MPTVIRDPQVMARMATTFELFELSLVMKRQNLRRSHPELDETEIERRVEEWLLKRSETATDIDGEGFRVRIGRV